jgi:hypothetical protein
LQMRERERDRDNYAWFPAPSVVVCIASPSTLLTAMKTAATCCNTSDHRREVVHTERDLWERERITPDFQLHLWFACITKSFHTTHSHEDCSILL